MLTEVFLIKTQSFIISSLTNNLSLQTKIKCDCLWMSFKMLKSLALLFCWSHCFYINALSLFLFHPGAFSLPYSWILVYWYIIWFEKNKQTRKQEPRNKNPFFSIGNEQTGKTGSRWTEHSEAAYMSILPSSGYNTHLTPLYAILDVTSSHAVLTGVRTAWLDVKTNKTKHRQDESWHNLH